MSVGGGILLGLGFSGITPEEYIRHIPTIVSYPSILIGLYKCAVFATVLATICTYVGYQTTGGAKGVGRSVVTTAVSTMVAIVLADWFTSVTAESLLNLFIGASI